MRAMLTSIGIAPPCFGRDAIDVRRLHVRFVVGRDVSIAEVVGEDHQEVGFVRSAQVLPESDQGQAEKTAGPDSKTSVMHGELLAGT
jgi:hypothetical protein